MDLPIDWEKLKEKSTHSVFAAFMSAMGADIRYKVFRNLHGAFKETDTSTIPDTEKWLEYYRNHKLLEQKASLFLKKKLVQNPDFYFIIIKAIYNVAFLNDDIFLKLFKLLPFGTEQDRKMWLGKYRSLPREKLKKKFKDNDNINLLAIDFKDSAMFFLARVWVPCTEIYGIYPPILYRKARQGDIDSIAKLLRVDKGVLQDQRISHHIHRISMDIESDNFKTLTRAFSGTISIPSFSKFKGAMAARLSEASKSAGENLTAPEIQKIFDLAYQVKHPQEIVDPDLPASPEAFAKTIQRKAPIYSSVSKLDKK